MAGVDAEDDNVETTPINVDRHKNRDPNRNPDTNKQAPAEEQRKNAMKDCPKTTILMRLSQFHHEKLRNAAKDFSTIHKDDEYAYKVWWEFNNAFGTLPKGHKELWPKDVNEKRPWPNPTEKTLSDAWEKVDALHHFIPNYFLNISDNHHEPTDISLDKIDGSFIHESDRDAITPRYPNWADMHFLIEFKRGGTANDPFDEKSEDGPDAKAKTRKAVRGQLMAYAERVFSYQHRSAVFFLLVNGKDFRVMCWDRSGVTATEAINYIDTIKGTQALLEVTYALSKLSRMRQGIDTTATRLLEGSCGWNRMDSLANASPFDLDYAEGLIEGLVHEVFTSPKTTATYGSISSDDDTDLHCDPTCSCCGHTSPPPVAPVLSHVRQMFRDSLVPGFPRYSLKVGADDYLVGKHIFIGSGMVGRGTRGYVALEWKTQRLVFLKDSWRAFYRGVESEGTILSKLNKDGIENVPTVIAHGDVFDPPEAGDEDKGEDEREGKDEGADAANGAGDDDVMQEDAKPDPVQGAFDASEPCDTSKDDDADKESAKPKPKPEPRLQETENARYHPKLGDMDVDPNLPPYLEKDPSALEEWIVNGEAVPKTPKRPTKSRSAPLPKKAAAQAKPEEDALSMPGLPAFPDGSTAAANPPVPSTPSRGVKRKYAFMLADDQGAGLRHMVHTRLVVKEVCLPITAFTSSNQLVRLIYECIMAHGLAWTKSKYMHRDVSAGNLLIYPDVVRTSNGNYHVFWRGVLADWELAKHVDKKVARQPQRTGTWHFMSAYLLLNPGMPTTIADELEAFLHVLIYAVVRRMRSDDITSVLDFLEAYFSGYAVKPKGRQVICPPAKRESVVITGTSLIMSGDPIVFSTPDGTLSKEHPINKLISDLIKIFHCRYLVLKYEKNLKASETSALQSTPTRRGCPTVAETDKGKDPDGEPRVAAPSEVFGPEDEDEDDDEDESEDSDDDALTKPRKKVFKANSSLESHRFIATTFHNAFTSQEPWPQNDVIPDRQNEVESDLRVAGRASAEDGAKKSGKSRKKDAETKGAGGVKDDPMDEDDPKPQAAPPPIHSDVPQAEDHDSVPKTDAQEASAVPHPLVERPKKRRRKDPVVKEVVPGELAVAESSTRRVTRSRTAANANAAAAATAAALGPVAAPAPVAAPPFAAAHAPAAVSRLPATAVVQASTRVTRSKSGKLPAPIVRAAAAAPSRATTTRRSTRSRAAGGTQTRRRGAAATETESMPPPPPPAPRRSARNRRS